MSRRLPININKGTINNADKQPDISLLSSDRSSILDILRERGIIVPLLAAQQGSWLFDIFPVSAHRNTIVITDMRFGKDAYDAVAGIKGHGLEYLNLIQLLF